MAKKDQTMPEDEFDDFVASIQEQINDETKAAYGQTAFERWQHPLYVGTINDPDGYARVRGTCGDTMEIFLKFEKGRVKDARFQTDGCGASTVCGSFAAELALGKDPDEITHISGEMINDLLGGLPEEEIHCAFLASETLQEALHAYMRKQRA